MVTYLARPLVGLATSRSLRVGVPNGVRWMSNQRPDAYLEPTEYTGTWSLVLNRPQAKNAISMRLLAVR